MSLRQPPFPGPSSGANHHQTRPTTSDNEEPYNIIPIHNVLADHPSLRFPQVHTTIAALRTVGNLRKPPSVPWLPHMDLLDWLAAFFGFQNDNVRNQREHLVLHLANAHMRLVLQPPSDSINSLDPTVLRRFRHDLLRNYFDWCSYLSVKSNICISNRRASGSDSSRELLYVSLYLLIWGESANLRFLPECLCYIFHHMAMELNRILEDQIDENTACLVLPSISGENAFLNRVVKPIYKTISAEVDKSKNGTAPHSAWRNYDDINEFFWSRRCFQQLKWPIDVESDFFVTSSKSRHVGKTGFVEQRSFWNLFRSFHRLWVLLILFLQVAIIIAWEEKKYPWQAMEDCDVQVRILTVFFTWSGLRFLQSLLDAGMQYSLVSRETLWVGVRMAMKSIVAAGWIIVFWFFYGRIWSQKNNDGMWSGEANKRIANFLDVAFVFVLPELLALALFILPWIWNYLEEMNWRIFYLLSWWFQSPSFVGHSLRVGLVDKTKYTLFWVMVLATKFSFSYFLQIKPMIAPTKTLLVHLRDIKFKWPEFFQNNNRFAVGLLWLPVVLIYLMDLQIWYSIYSSFLGAAVGLFAHLGEIRNTQQLRLRFQFFASAIQFNLMPEERLSNARRASRTKINDAIRHLMLRYGFGKPYKKFESNQIEAKKFALIWNEIILTFREEDIISDREVELLELPPNSWNIRVIRWPCFLLCNELLLALSQAKELVDAPDKCLWYKICKNEYRRCAVIEAYDSVKHLLHEIIKYNTEEQSIVTILFQEIDHSLETEEFTKTFKMTALPQIHLKLISLLDILNKPKKDPNKVVNILQALYGVAIRDLFKEKRSSEQLREVGLAPRNSNSSAGLLFENSVEFPDDGNEIFYRQVRRLHTILISRDSKSNIPTNLEARRRIAFFSNSLFMNMPHAPQVEKMMAFSVLTPFYNEEVLYSKEQLQTENEDGISILYYLRTIYADEWKNFMERMHQEGMLDDEDIWTNKLRDLQLWASYRGQTLSRTVRGMMYYHRALMMLAFLDSASEMDIREGSRELGSMRRDDSSDGFSTERSSSLKSLSRTSSSVNLLFKGHEYGTALMKYTYVVACQIYGAQKAKKDPHAEDILYLMKSNEALRVAYVDEVSTGRDEKDYYSVLVKYDQQLQKEVEIYRIKLPGPLKLGEGKPENQNHALIFTRGDAVQTIDMNQDNYLEEALKMRNLLEEYRTYDCIRKPTILGVREHIFTGSVSSLAWFMSAQETGFVTVGQRVSANPMKIRMHYGHPDVFDRFWFLTRGGISKASKVININEDIFAGFNCTLRGGSITHHEYIQVGKGRDVGLNQISMFEAKVASGSGEQILSRDVYRLGHRLDFFRMLSFFHTSVGFFFNAMVVVLSIYVYLWGQLYVALSGVEASFDFSAENKAITAILTQQFVVQLGLFSFLPMTLESYLEQGYLSAVREFIIMQLQLSSVFYTFSLGTRIHFFGRTILHGGAKYLATGRGFVVQHKSFAENYRLYARSHFVKAIELGLIFLVYASYSRAATKTYFYIDMSISCWFLIGSWIMGPFLFNPSGFDWLKTVNDFHDFMDWIWYPAGVFANAENCWERWWYEEQNHLKKTGLLGKLLEIILNLRFFFFQYAIVYQLHIAGGSSSIAVYLLSWIFVFLAVGIYVGITYAGEKFAAKQHYYYRMIQLVVFIEAIVGIVALRKFTKFKYSDLFTSLLAFIPTGWGLISNAQVLRCLLQSTMLWETVVSVARLYEIIFGVIVMAPVAVLSWLPGFQSMQTRILFNEPFNRGLRIFQILTEKKS